MMASRADEAALTPHLQGEVHHDDAVLLDQAHQHDEAHEAEDVELLAEQEQRQQRAHHGQRQGRQDGDGVDEVLIQDGQHHVDHQDGDR